MTEQQKTRLGDLFPFDWDADGNLDVIVSYAGSDWDSEGRTLAIALGDGAGGFTVSVIDSTTHQWGGGSERPDAVAMPVFE